MTGSGHRQFETDRLQQLLDAALQPEEEARLLSQLENSEQQRERLENLAADPEFREDVHRYLSQPAKPDGTIDHIVDALRDLLQDSGEPCLDFLEPDDRPDSIGQFDGYSILECIGNGGMGIVLKARDPSLSRVVAIKVMAPQLAASVNARKRFLREARAAAAVSHDHVITIHAVNSDGTLPYLVMEFIDGVSLAERLMRVGSLPVPEILRIARQTASGLAAAHAQGLIHRDIKPDNILLENGIQRVKITDFGLARAANDNSVTRTGDVIGTPEYMSPEQARGESLDCRADLFSLGSVIYAMCTGQSPFKTKSTTGTIRRVCDEQPPPIRELNPDIPDWLIGIVNRLHAKDPADRYESAAEVEDLLTSRLAEVQGGATARMQAAPTDAGPEGTRRRSYWSFIVPLAALLPLVAMTAAWWRSGDDASPDKGPDVPRSAAHRDEAIPDRRSPSSTTDFIDVERDVACWTLELNGKLKLHVHGTIEDVSDLPETPFQIQGVHLWHRELTDEDVPRLAPLTRLRALDIRGNHLTSASLPHLCNLTTLRWLYLGKMNIDDTHLAELNRLPLLEALGLEGTGVTDQGVAQLREMKHLRELRIGNTAITDQAVEHACRWTTLVRLDLFGTDVSDAGVKHMTSLTHLRYLILQQTRVTDRSFEILRMLPALVELNLKETAVTPEGVASFRAERPDCTVEY
ncbi:protein kinase [Maioricimonas sp. JC845]|uniref:protein kinase domain-containing protein n=1 Tax=Maioricimonas sp. JC845 TaxID=3232138 RepID=UPI003459C3CA